MDKINIVHLYPEEMNIYGDLGNIIALRKRLEWRGFEVEYRPVNLGEECDFGSADIVFGGGGQDKGQISVAEDLKRHKEGIIAAADNGVVFLMVCGMYQLFGHKFITQEGEELEGVGVFDTETHGSSERMIGNIVIQTHWGEIVGFENHSGKTYLSTDQSALGRVVKGYGNNGEDGFEGALNNNCFGTYLHGSLLPKNPFFADELISRALQRKGIDIDKNAENIDDSIAHKAAEIAKKRPQ